MTDLPHINLDTLTVKAARAIAGNLGYPSKMPGTSYGTPAEACKTGSKLHLVPDSVYEECYAFGGNYIFPDVKKAQAFRLESINSPLWVGAMVKMLTITHLRGTGRNGPIDAGWHRWHDSGDLQSLEHLEKICEICRQTESVKHKNGIGIKHWLPTREKAIVRAYRRKHGAEPSNLCIRVSATMIDGPAPKNLAHTSTVHRDTLPPENERCPAPDQDNKCGDCRRCWDKTAHNTSYKFHN